MMVIDLKVSLCRDSNVYVTVKSQLHQHVVKEPDTGEDIAFCSAIEINNNLNPSFLGFTIDFGVTDPWRFFTHTASLSIFAIFV
jgi:hypothetical protein